MRLSIALILILILCDTIVLQLYALINQSGHTGFPLLQVAGIHAAGTAASFIMVLFMKINKSRYAVLIGLIGGFGMINPIVMDAMGILQQYDHWCKAGMHVPGLNELLTLILLTGISMILILFL